MRREIAKTPVDPTLFPEAAHKFARRALREHQRAERDAVNAVQHAVKSGQALLKAYDLCEYGQWNGFFEMHFKKEKFSLRTGHKYMQLARNWSQLADQHPAGFSSQRQALKALAAIVRAEKPRRTTAVAPAHGATGGNQRARTGPVWRASGPFVREALKLVTSLDATLSHLIAHGYGLEDVAANVRAALDRLRQMLDTDIDQAEALQAAGDWTFVAEPAPPPDGAAPADASEREASRTESGATTSTPARGARLRARGRGRRRPAMTTKTSLNPLARMAAERRNALKLLAKSANLSHRWATASAGAAMAHVVAAGHALVQARDLCEEGGWLRWLRTNFEGSVRAAQRYIRVARHLPASGIDATRVSHRSQAAVLRAIRGVVFTAPAAAENGAPVLAGPPAACGDRAAAHRRLALVAARRLRKLAVSLAATAAGAEAAELVERINALAADLLLDVGVCAGRTGEVYFIEAVETDRVKIGVSGDVDKRFRQLAASFPDPLRLLGRVAGGRAHEASLHRRLANFHIGGEWFHLTPGVRAVVTTVIADEPE